jgi:hypothetical protein
MFVMPCCITEGIGLKADAGAATAAGAATSGAFGCNDVDWALVEITIPENNTVRRY